jgi:hypothetical protein
LSFGYTIIPAAAVNRQKIFAGTIVIALHAPKYIGYGNGAHERVSIANCL